MFLMLLCVGCVIPGCWLFYWSGVVQGSTGVISWLKSTVSIRGLWSYDDFMTRHRVRLDCDWGYWVGCVF